MELKDYIGKKIYGWLAYYSDSTDGYSDNRKCQVYPRIVYNNNEFQPISPEDFPTNGFVNVRFNGGSNVDELYLQTGPVVEIRMNYVVGMDFGETNQYTFKYNPKYSRLGSEIWLDTFDDKKLYQVIEVNDLIDELEKSRVLQNSNKICADQLLLKNKQLLYGPFDIERDTDSIVLRAEKENDFLIGEYKYCEHNHNIIPISDENGKVQVSFYPKELFAGLKAADKTYDWIDDKALIDNFIKKLKELGKYTKDNLNLFKNMLQTSEEIINDSTETEERRERLKKVLAYSPEVTAYAADILNFVADKPEFQEKLSLEALERIALESQKGNNKYKPLLTRKEDQEKIDKQASEIKQLKSDNEALRKNILDVYQEKEDIKLKEIMPQYNKMLEAIDALKEEEKELRDKIEKSRDEYFHQANDYELLQDHMAQLLKDFNSQTKLLSKVVDKRFWDVLLDGGSTSKNALENTASQLQPFNSTLLRPEMKGDAVISQVKDFINNRANRNMDYNEVANLLICVTQGFIVTLSGPPGTGKSTLVTILAKALGLATNDEQKRFVDISVERGWTSPKDWLAYWNALGNHLETNNADVLDAFTRMDFECRCTEQPNTDESTANWLIGLDEANLSQIEHYWSVFLKHCDFTEGDERKIEVGGNISFLIPEYLRFIATINFDHTTEALSQRFLDRSWIISIEPSDSDIIRPCGKIENADKMYSYKTLKDAFILDDDTIIDSEIIDKWTKIKEIFKDAHTPIMPRNRVMVHNYCQAACKWMKRDTAKTKFAPLDFAISQKILPTINGSGENYRRLIDNLLDECPAETMPMCNEHLNRIKRVAITNMGFYQFFAR